MVMSDWGDLLGRAFRKCVYYVCMMRVRGKVSREPRSFFSTQDDVQARNQAQGGAA
jgi:hypothetical protein